MADVVEIIHDLTYNVNDKGLEKALASVQAQVKNIDLLTAALKKQEAAFNATSANETQKRATLTAVINNTKKAIEAQTQSLVANIAQNKVLNDAIQKELSLVGQLSNKLKELKNSRDKATSIDDVRRYNREIADAQSRLDKLTGTTGGFAKGLGGSLLTGIGIGSGIQAFQTISNLVTDFLDKSSQLAKETEGVERAFNNLNRPGLLENLRTATRNTVSDLELMKRAVQFNNFGLPVEKLGDAFAFARQRARDTGESVDYLVQSITIGIGRQSPLILDNLGINARRVREEFKKTGDFAQAAFKIINEEAAKSADGLDTYADRIDRINASLENTQAKFGQTVNNIKGGLIAIGQDIGDLFTGGATFDGTKTNVGKYRQALEDKDKAEEDSRQANIVANQRFLENFQSFTEAYANADHKGREDIKQQATAMYKTLTNVDEAWANAAGVNLQNYLEGVKRAFAQANAVFAKTAVNLQKLDVATFDQLTKEELEEIQKKVKDSRTPLTATDVDQIARLNKLDEASQKQLDIINGKKDQAAAKSAKTAESLAEKRAKFEADLLRKIADLEADGQQLRLKGEEETTEKIVREIDIRINKELQELKIQEDAARRRGLLTENAKKYFEQIRDLFDQNALLDFNNRNTAFRVKQQGEQRDFATGALQGELDRLKGSGALPGGNSLNDIRRQAQLETQIALAEAEKKYSALLDQAKRNNEDLTELAQRREEDLLLIVEQGNRKMLDAELTYLENLRKETEQANRYLISLTQAQTNDELDELEERFGKGLFAYFRYQKNLQRIKLEEERKVNKQNQESLKQQLLDAQDSFDRIDADPNRTQSDLDAAQERITRIRSELAQLKQESRETEHQLLEIRISDINKVIDLYSQLAFSAVSAYNQIADAQQASLNREIHIREQRVTQATRLAERGNVELLRLEQDRLDKALKQREEAARRQMIINQALAVSEAIVGVVKAATEGDPYTVIARVIAFIAALAAGYAAVTASTTNASSQGFYEGSYTGEGDPRDVAGVVHKKEFVFDHKATAKIGRENLEKLRTGQIELPVLRSDLALAQSGEGFATKKELKELGTKMDKVVDAIYDTESHVSAKIDEHGVGIATEKAQKRERRRFAA